MKRRGIFLSLLVCMLLTMLAPAVSATEAEAAKSGTCGEGITWKLDGYTLTISGSGEMEDGCPWEAHKDHIDTVIFKDGVTKIGAEAFKDHIWIRNIDFGDSLREIGDKAFYGCKRITWLHLPATFRIFGAQSFRDCESLTKVYCDGGMPRFNDSCLWTGSYISVFYPTNNPWPWEYTSQLISSYGGNMGIFMGNFDDTVVQETVEATEAEEETEATEAPTEAATEPAVVVMAEDATEATVPETTVPETTVPETTVPETTVPETTVAQTEQTSVPTTEAEETTAVVEFTEETEPVEENKKTGGKSWIGLVMIAGVITFLLAGAMIFRSSTHRGGRY